MREFPPAEELNFLVDKTPTQFRINRGKLDLAFQESCLIAMEHWVYFVDAENRRFAHNIQDGYSPDSICFHQILNSRVAAVDRKPFVLTLKFENGTALEIHSVEGPYESGMIGFHHPDGRGDLIVF